MTASIVVPVYNAKETLDRCLEAIAAQTHRELEVILVDDGSTDGSGAVCDRWAAKDPRFRVIHQENRGPGPARNAGMAEAKGDWLFFFDSDDTMENTLVGKTIACFRETGAQVVLYGCCHVYPSGRRVNRPLTGAPKCFSGAQIREELLPGLFTYAFGAGVSPWGKGYDLAFLHQQGLEFPRQRGLVCEDGEFMIALFSRVSRAALLPECLYHYYRASSSLSRRFAPDRQQRNNAFLNRCEALIRQEGLPEKTRTAVCARYHGLTLGTVTALLRADLPRTEQSRILNEILRDPILRRTLSDEVLALDGALPRLFWRCLRGKQYGLCRSLLWGNHIRQRREEQP